MTTQCLVRSKVEVKTEQIESILWGVRSLTRFCGRIEERMRRKRPVESCRVKGMMGRENKRQKAREMGYKLRFRSRATRMRIKSRQLLSELEWPGLDWRLD